MKFVCMTCEAFMLFEKVDTPGEGSLGVQFSCPTCGHKVAMVTNPGETQMVHSLGVTLGGRTKEAQPFELTRETMKESSAPSSGSGGSGGTGGSCPFSAVVQAMEGSSQSSASGGDVLWTEEAAQRLEKIPQAIRPMIQRGIEAYARKKGHAKITGQVMDESKNDMGMGLEWAPGAEKRLENLPAFIRPMAKVEIERMAMERGQGKVTEALMDEAKEKFLKMMTL